MFVHSSSLILCISLSTLPPPPSISPPVTYYGLYDIEGATSNDNLLIDAYASFNTHLGFKHRMSLMSLMEAFPVCGMVQKQNSNSNWYSNMYNKNGGSSCPNDGTYNFQTMFALDAPKSRFLSWFMTGYHGEAVVDIYMERTMDLVGRCHIPIKTKPTLPILSGMVSMTLLIVGTIILVSFGLAGKLPKCPPLPRSCLGRRRKGGEDDNNDVLLLPYEHQFGKTIETAKKYRKEPVTDLVAW